VEAEGLREHVRRIGVDGDRTLDGAGGGHWISSWVDVAHRTACRSAWLPRIVGALWHREVMRHKSELLMTSGVTAVCSDCGDERVFVPTGDPVDGTGEFCCTSCDAGVFLCGIVLPAVHRHTSRVA